MEFEKYDSEEHGYFLDEFTRYSREPNQEEADFFSELLQEKVEKISDIAGQESDFKLYFAMTDESGLEDELPVNRYVHGFSFAEWMEGFDHDVIMIRAVRDRENWKSCLVNMLAHEIAHQEFYSKTERMPYSNWYNLVFEGHAMNRAEQVTEELGVDWKPDYRSYESIEAGYETIAEVLEEDRTHESDGIFQNGEKPCENAEGYNIAYRVVKDITDRRDLTLDTLVEEDADVLKKEVEKSLKKVLE